MAIHKFTRLIEEGEEIPQFGDGGSSRDYTYIDDILDAIESAAQRALGYEILNLGESRTITLRTLIALIEKELGKTARIRALPPQPGDVRATWADRAPDRDRPIPRVPIEEASALRDVVRKERRADEHRHREPGYVGRHRRVLRQFRMDVLRGRRPFKSIVSSGARSIYGLGRCAQRRRGKARLLDRLRAPSRVARRLHLGRDAAGRPPAGPTCRSSSGRRADRRRAGLLQGRRHEEHRPGGTGARVKAIIRSLRAFVQRRDSRVPARGVGDRDFMRPNRVVIGADDRAAAGDTHRPADQTPVVVTDLASAG
jgi:hypothetical protein